MHFLDGLGPNDEVPVRYGRCTCKPLERPLACAQPNEEASNKEAYESAFDRTGQKNTINQCGYGDWNGSLMICVP